MLIPNQTQSVMRTNTLPDFGSPGIDPSRWPPSIPNIPVPGQKRTYCCKYGPGDDPERYCRQFRATSAQASLFCVRFARSCPDCGSGTAGRLSRGECDC
jgi:hypothetical protein